MNWDMITKEVQQIIIALGLFQLLIWLVFILIIWFFIKSAVRAGVKEALETTVVTVQVKDIANGLVFYTRDATPQNTYHTEKQQPQNNYTPQQKPCNSWRS